MNELIGRKGEKIGKSQKTATGNYTVLLNKGLSIIQFKNSS